MYFLRRNDFGVMFGGCCEDTVKQWNVLSDMAGLIRFLDRPVSLKFLVYLLPFPPIVDFSVTVWTNSTDPPWVIRASI